MKKLATTLGLLIAFCVAVGIMWAVASTGSSGNTFFERTVVGITIVDGQKSVLLDNSRSHTITDEAAEDIEIGDTCVFLYTTEHRLGKIHFVGAYCNIE